MLWAAVLLATGALQVGGPGGPATIGEALAAAGPGDTIHVAAGTYREKLVVEVPVTLIGHGGPIIDGAGEGTVVELRAPGSRIVGFRIRGSGRVLDREDAGVLVTADSCVVAGNELSDVLFGIYLKQGHGGRVVDNVVEGKDRPLGRRGDGIRLWYSDDVRVERNTVRRTRDVVIYFSHGLEFRDNRVSDGRYGLHYMYSSDNLFERNEFVGNDVASFIMYSSDIVLRDNIFARAAGRSGYGIGLKDADRIEVVHNLIVQNQVGLYFDNAPSAMEAQNIVRHNWIVFNDIGVELLPSVRRNDFVDNKFIGNMREVSVSGGGTALGNSWSGNAWDDAAAWDADDDGTPDLPYRIDRLSDDLFARHPALRLYELSPAALALDALGRFFPLLEPKPIVVDSLPQTLPREREPRAVGLAADGEQERKSGRAPLLATLWLGLAAVSVWGVWRWPL